MAEQQVSQHKTNNTKVSTHFCVVHLIFSLFLSTFCIYLSWFSHRFNQLNYNLFADIDLTDPEVEAAAAKIQSVFKMRGKKNKK